MRKSCLWLFDLPFPFSVFLARCLFLFFEILSFLRLYILAPYFSLRRDIALFFVEPAMAPFFNKRLCLSPTLLCGGWSPLLLFLAGVSDYFPSGRPAGVASLPSSTETIPLTSAGDCHPYS